VNAGIVGFRGPPRAHGEVQNNPTVTRLELFDDPVFEAISRRARSNITTTESPT